MKLIIIFLVCFKVSVPYQLIGCEANAENWQGYDLENSIVLGKDDAGEEILKIRLIEPEAIIWEGTGGYDPNEGETISTYKIGTPDHGFLCTSEGDLFIDNFYAGRFSKKDDLVYGNGRIWSNGVPCLMKQMTNDQRKNLYIMMDLGVLQPDGSKLVYQEDWKIYLRPGGNGGGVCKIGKSFIFSDGMTVVRVEEGKLMVNGMNYGSIISGQEIKVIDCIVMVDNKKISPVSIARKPIDAPLKH